MAKLFLLMALMEVFADACLQYKLSHYKRKENCTSFKGWKKNVWVPTLFLHALIVSMFMLTPALLLTNVKTPVLVVLLIGNTIIHALIDNEKANHHALTNIEDRFLHEVQVILSWIILIENI